MARPKPKPKSKPRARRQPAPAVTEEAVERAAGQLAALATAHGGEGAVLQVDFLGDERRGRSIIRVKSTPRIWTKLADTDLVAGQLQALVDRELIDVSERTRLGWTVRPRSGLLQTT